MTNGSTGSLTFDLLFAGIAVVGATVLIWRNWRGLVFLSAGVGVVAAGIGILVLVVGTLAWGGMLAYESYKTKQCQTVHERVAKSRSAPADFFGDQMRRDADAEQASCNELATRLASRAKE